MRGEGRGGEKEREERNGRKVESKTEGSEKQGREETDEWRRK